MPMFRKKPVVIEAHRFSGSSSEVRAFEQWFAGHEFLYPVVCTRDLRQLEIKTPGGVVLADPGDWIIKGVAGEFYPCKPGIFSDTYEDASETSDD